MAGAEHGGAEAFFERLVAALHRSGLEQKVLIRRNARRAALLRDQGVDVSELPFGGSFDFATRREFQRHIDAYAPRVVLTWMNRATKHCPASKGRFAHVGRLGGYYDLKYYRRCDHLIGNTEDIVAYLAAQGWPPERAHYLPNFVAAEKASALPRARFDTPAEAPLVVALGRLHPNKAFDVLLDAMARLPRAYLWLAGEGPLREALAAQADRLGIGERVRFLGWRDDAGAVYAAADVFACPSRHEPLGNVVIEAWAQGAPVVAAASQGPAKLVADGESGLLAPPDDPDALAAAIGRVLVDKSLAGRLAAGGRAAFEASFTEAAVVARYRAFFDKVAG
jgi:glycosyltransferase involved in cell wall biosynthesis